MDQAAISAGFDFRRYAMRPSTSEAKDHHRPCGGLGDGRQEAADFATGEN